MKIASAFCSNPSNTALALIQLQRVLKEKNAKFDKGQELETFKYDRYQNRFILNNTSGSVVIRNFSLTK